MVVLTRRSFIKTGSMGIAGACIFPMELGASESAIINFAMSNGGPPLSYQHAGHSVGIIPDLLKALFKNISGFEAKLTPYPWRRAQNMVKFGAVDAFCTYPSIARQKYAAFASLPLYTLDMGYLVFRKDHPKAEALKRVKNYKDLARFNFLSERGIGWEIDNIPAFINRTFAPDMKSLLRLLFLRNIGDFYVANIQQVQYLAKKSGYLDRMDFAKVDFITNSKVDYHIGISRKRSDAEELAQMLFTQITSTAFGAAKEKILSQY